MLNKFTLYFLHLLFEYERKVFHKSINVLVFHFLVSLVFSKKYAIHLLYNGLL